MSTTEMIPTLALVTLVIAAIIGVILLLRHRKRNGAHPMRGQSERNVGERIDRAGARRE